MMMVSVLCICFVGYPDLHPFPTRRSSDLVLGGVGAGERLFLGAERFDRGDGAEDLVRSEEHTSELQSCPHLVCRLLLEKTTRLLNFLILGEAVYDDKN